MRGRLRYQRRFRLVPGVALNLSRTGTSWSLGPRGAHLTFARGRRSQVNVGLPGTGIRYVAFGDRPAAHEPERDNEGCLVRGCAPAALIAFGVFVWWLVSVTLGWL